MGQAVESLAGNLSERLARTFAYFRLRALMAPPLLLGCGLAHAVSPTAELDVARAAAIQQALQVDAEAWHAERLGAASAATTLYVGIADTELLLRKVEVRIDEAPARVYDFSLDQSRALRRGGLFALMVHDADAALHRIRARFVSRTMDVRGKPIFAQLDETLDFPAGRNALVLEQQPAGTFGGPRLSWAQSAVPAGLPGGSDPRLLAVDVDLAAADYVSAASRLLRAEALAGAGAAPMPEFSQRLDASLRGLGVTSGSASDGAAISGDYSRFNAAVEAINAGQAATGIAILQSLGSTKLAESDSAALALRDRANLLLGAQSLSSGDGMAAIEAYKRVRSPGPYSTAALLGLGWAYLQPAGSGGDAAEAADVPDGEPTPWLGGRDPELAALRREQPFRYYTSTASARRADDLNRALVPWAELVGRDPLDPAVQEGMLAVPYAMDHLGSRQQAVQRYERAIELLELSYRRLGAAVDDVAHGGLAATVRGFDAGPSRGWAWWLVELPDAHWWLQSDDEASPMFYVAYLLESEPVRDAIRKLRSLDDLDRLLAARAASLRESEQASGALPARIDATRARLRVVGERQAREMEALASAQLQELRKQTERYLVEAHFALARLYDRPPVDLAMSTPRVQR